MGKQPPHLEPGPPGDGLSQASSDGPGVDTNGAGDSFFAGVMTANLAGAEPEHALTAGADQALRALATRSLAPGLVAT